MSTMTLDRIQGAMHLCVLDCQRPSLSTVRKWHDGLAEAIDAYQAKVRQPAAWMSAHEGGSIVSDEARTAIIALRGGNGSSHPIPLYAAPPAEDNPLSGKYGDVLVPFLAMMDNELHANAGKGDRPGWLAMDPNTALFEIYYHMAKLTYAIRKGNAAETREFAADVANMSMMLLDVCGLLAVAPEVSRG